MQHVWLKTIKVHLFVENSNDADFKHLTTIMAQPCLFFFWLILNEIDAVRRRKTHFLFEDARTSCDATRPTRQ